MTVRENQQQIQSILRYWFGQYAPETSQKKLWMIASSSVELRERVDAEIAERFEDTISGLAQEDGIWYEWCHDVELYGYAGKVAAIVALDQFSRHVTRHYAGQEECAIPPQIKLDARAYQTAQMFTEQHEQEIRCGMVPLPIYIFALMPYRHASTFSSIQYVRECIDKSVVMEEQMDAMIRRFRKATNRRMAVLQDEAQRTGLSETDEKNGSNIASNEIKDEDILETFPFEADMSSAKNHIVHKTIASFLAARGVRPSGKQPSQTTPVIVSLSGGVDSMVIASVLAHLCHESNHHLKIVAIHIDYANRPESGAEAAYVSRYCELLRIDYKCRRIDEVTRGVAVRDDYERIAREARYSMYRQTVVEYTNGDSGMEVGIILGHHRGDLRENVLSNSHKGSGPLDLSGMTDVSTNDGVVIYRPLLSLEKKEIFDYANCFGVPYFKDTTPHWSTRGKLRNKLLPLLQEIYGEGSMDNLSTLATESDEARELLHKTVLAPFLDQVEHKPMGITFATQPWKEQGLFFWKFVLREALHSAGLGMFSNKSVIAFLERVQADNIRAGWLQCRRDYAVYLEEVDGRVFVFFPKSFPFRTSQQYDCVGKGKNRASYYVSIKSRNVSNFDLRCE
jgi:tRNA(Ile)-lysidine synthetase-like protein